MTKTGEDRLTNQDALLGEVVRMVAESKENWVSPVKALFP